MNILYLSKLSGNLFAGPNNSVPSQIKAQSNIDNVFWYNLNTIKRDEWIKIGCKNLENYPSGRLRDLPIPFNNPDIVVIEEFYCYPFSYIIKEIQRKKIPYIIIPRSELTEQAQKKRSIKKKIGNILFFNNMVKKSAAIQYLSKQEKIESVSQWNKRSFIIPNGTDIKEDVKKEFSTQQLKGVYIGRYEKYQKGLDILISAIIECKQLLRDKGFVLEMYGVDQENTIKEIQKEILLAEINDLVKINGSIFGEEKKKKLLDSDIFIMTSRFEGMPMGMIEALSYGVPCIATIGTNMADEVEKYNAGWIAENNTESVKKAFINMVEDTNLIKKSKNALLLAKKYSWENIAVQSHKIYEKIMRN